MLVIQNATVRSTKELHVELVDVEANPLRELPLSGMNELQKKRARQLAFMLTMHRKDRALQMITKLSDPANAFEIWRWFLEEWELAHSGRYRAMLMQLLLFPFTGDRGQALEDDSCGSTRHRVLTRFRTRSKQQYWYTTHKIQNGAGTSD